MNLIKPSFSTGYAKNASESANPNLWKGLVGAWMPSFGVTGGTLKDVSGNGNDGTLTNMDAASDWVGTSNGLALDFDGVNDYVGIPDDEIFKLGNNDFSLFCNLFFRPSGGDDCIFEFRGSAGSYSSWVWFINANNRLQVWKPNLTTQSSVALVNNSWCHIGLVRKNNVLTYFINGNSSGSSSWSENADSDSSGIRIGTRQDTTNSLSAKFTAAHLHNRALSPTEIKQLYLNPSAPFQKKTTTVVSVPVAPPTTTAKAVVLKKPKPSYATGYARNASESANPNLWKGLVGAWMPSFGVTGGTLKDVSGNGNDGTLTNMDAATDWVATSKGLGLEFGVSTYENVSVRPEALSTDAGSFFCWYKRTSVIPNNRDAMILTGYTSSSVRNFLEVQTYVLLNGQPRIATGFNAGIGGNGVFGPAVYLNEWLHLGYSWSDGKPATLWVNGRFYAQTANSFVDYGNYSSVKIGNYHSANFSASGVIADAFSYNRALSPTEIKQLYLNPSAPFERKQQTVGISTAQAFNPYWANQATQLAGTLQ